MENAYNNKNNMTNALILYGLGLTFATIGYFNRNFLMAGFVVFGIIAIYNTITM